MEKGMNGDIKSPLHNNNIGALGKGMNGDIKSPLHSIGGSWQPYRMASNLPPPTTLFASKC